jgi:predicted O-methyltransferase YrrM
MPFLRNVAINIESALQQRRWLRDAIKRIELAPQEYAAPLTRALRAVRDGDFAAEDVESFRRVEALRRSLLRNFRPLEIVDFGAGGSQAPPEHESSRAPASVRTTIARSALSSKSPFWARLLFMLVREARPARCLELGSNLGLSAAYQASALRLNGTGLLVTLEGAEPRARLARQNLARLGLDNATVVTGEFRNTLAGILEVDPPVDFAFIDGHHDEHATREYFERIAARAAPTAIIVLDDISWSDGMKRAWRSIRSDSRVALAVDLRVIGLCLLRASDT